MEEFPTSNIAIIGDFNTAIDTYFDLELFTHFSNAHGTTSWLDHVKRSHDIQARLHSIEILGMLPSSS